MRRYGVEMADLLARSVAWGGCIGCGPPVLRWAQLPPSACCGLLAFGL